MTNISAANLSSNNTSSSPAEDLPYKAEGIALCSAFALEAVFIVVGNLLAIVLFAVNKNLRKKSLFLVINMAFADLMLGTVVLPLHIYHLGDLYWMWTSSLYTSLYTSLLVIQIIFLQVSLVSATLISVERFYAIYWPLKHRTLSKRAYRVVIFMAWVLSVVVSTVYLVLPYKDVIYFVLLLLALLLLFIVCGLNIAIWRKFQRGRIASQLQRRSSQNQRLTKTLLLVSTVAVLSWLPIIIMLPIRIYEDLIPYSIYQICIILCFSNSFFNPVIYAFRIREFRQGLSLCGFRRQAAIDMEGNERRDKRAMTLLTTLPADVSNHQLLCNQQTMDTNL